ncbi:hypothetical protein GGS23DRAFT_388038 [Durotheca rogersii]|uniref:uncharacterized protein n=1 Tax=Durotheca rogersii TaxID=419775 RepID=UPI00221E9021|nr:uncharacterized protein GGS23DRAFT_388038 [Durotheca rogersii]KAI5857335.1 hypothetical protein GGS23DRAFT_388038 [Durotheca rogersii]
MGFTTGFTGGVAITLSVAYLTVWSHQQNRVRQAAVLRQQTYALSALVDPLPPALPPTRAELAAAERAHFVERAKDRWNAELEGAVRWAQEKDWDEVREDVEAAAARLWARAFADADGGVAAPGDKLAEGKTVAAEKGSGVAPAAKSSYAEAKTGPSEAETANGSVWASIGAGFASAAGAAGRIVGIAGKDAKQKA